MNTESNNLNRILTEQKRCAHSLLDPSETDKRGSRLGLADWTMEEVLIQEKRKQKIEVLRQAQGGRPMNHPIVIPFGRSLVGAITIAASFEQSPLPLTPPLNAYERELFQLLLEQGFRPLHCGWPDFGVLDESNQLIGCVEVKSECSPNLRPEQDVINRGLGAFGIPCYRWSLEEGFKKLTSNRVLSAPPDFTENLPIDHESLTCEELGLFIRIRQFSWKHHGIRHGMFTELPSQFGLTRYKFDKYWARLRPLFNESNGALYYGPDEQRRAR